MNTILVLLANDEKEEVKDEVSDDCLSEDEMVADKVKVDSLPGV